MNSASCIRVESLTDFLYEHFQGPPKGIIFDCDGVLVDSVEANMAFYNKIREDLGLPLLDEAQREYCQMATYLQAVDHIVPDALKSLLPDVLNKMSYARDYTPLIKASDDLIPLLHAFKPHLRLGVHTNRMGPIDDMLKNLGMEGFFNPIITVANASPKPSPEGTVLLLKQWDMQPKEVLFIGDSLADRETAKAAQVPFMSYRNPRLLERGTCCDYNDLSEALSLLFHFDEK